MIRKILSFCLLIGLTHPSIKGSEMTDITQTDQSSESNFSHFVERSKETKANIIECNLLAYMGRYDKLTERSKEFDRFIELFFSTPKAISRASRRV